MSSSRTPDDGSDDGIETPTPDGLFQSAGPTLRGRSHTMANTLIAQARASGVVIEMEAEGPQQTNTVQYHLVASPHGYPTWVRLSKADSLLEVTDHADSELVASELLQLDEVRSELMESLQAALAPDTFPDVESIRFETLPSGQATDLGMEPEEAFNQVTQR